MSALRQQIDVGTLAWSKDERRAYFEYHPDFASKRLALRSVFPVQRKQIAVRVLETPNTASPLARRRFVGCILPDELLKAAMAKERLDPESVPDVARRILAPGAPSP
jgi:hypothetical protein